MTEADVVSRTETPATVASLVAAIRELGVEAGTTLMVHSSLSRLGWVCGGAEAVVIALLEVVGPTGTLVVPTHSGGRSDPAGWQAPAVPEAWWDTVRAETPPFDPRLTPTRQMGAVVECLRHVEGFVRSAHPALSVGAVGPAAVELTRDHRAPAMGEGSPLARLYDADAEVLLLGVGHANNTCLHLAEHRTAHPTRPTGTFGATLAGGWTTWDDLDHDSDDFETIGDAFAATGAERSGPVGAGTGRAMAVRAAVDFAVTWMERNRPALPVERADHPA